MLYNIMIILTCAMILLGYIYLMIDLINEGYINTLFGILMIIVVITLIFEVY